jgi:hypothetical protein
MLDDFEHPLAGYIFSAEDVLQEGQDVVWTFRSTKRNQQHRIVGCWHSAPANLWEASPTAIYLPNFTIAVGAAPLETPPTCNSVA